MTGVAAIIVPQAAVDEVKSYLRLFAADEDALVRGCLASAIALCEGFTGQAMLLRQHEAWIAPDGGWTRLAAVPVRAIASVEAVDGAGAATMLPGAAYLVDLDASASGWVRMVGPSDGRVRVRYEAGMASEWEQLPESLRHGIVRLAAHLFSRREDAVAAPPAAVSALWRPWRRMRIGARHVRAG